MAKHIYPADAGLILKDAGAVTADGAATVGGSAKVLDVGPGRLRDGAAVEIYITACDFTNTDETYAIVIQASNDATPFATTTRELARFVVPGGTTGRQQIMITNEWFGVIYRNIRVYTDVSGTTPSINYTARLTQMVA